jgi:cysteine desulfuration protein SufE
MDAATMDIDTLVEDFAFLDDWEDRYRYVIELGKALPELPDAERTEANKVRGCASQVWLVSELKRNGDARLRFRGDSDAHIVRGLIAILFALYSGRTPREILATDAEACFARLGLREHLTAQRSNGLSSMVARIRADAEAALTPSLT